jgi:hypothetical protein
MRMPEPMPRGLTFLLAITLATVSASLVKVPSGGKVETVLTLLEVISKLPQRNHEAG